MIKSKLMFLSISFLEKLRNIFYKKKITNLFEIEKVLNLREVCYNHLQTNKILKRFLIGGLV